MRIKYDKIFKNKNIDNQVNKLVEISKNNTDNFNKKRVIDTLIRQSARWTVASGQDETPLVSLLHANYGVAYLNALKDIATDKDIEKVKGINVVSFTKKINSAQDRATKRVAKNCPMFFKNLDVELMKLAGNL
jgi:hypothetical protein